MLLISATSWSAATSSSDRQVCGTVGSRSDSVQPENYSNIDQHCLSTSATTYNRDRLAATWLLVQCPIVKTRRRE